LFKKINLAGIKPQNCFGEASRFARIPDLRKKEKGKRKKEKVKKDKLLLFLKEGRLEAGCDEAGRGCLAGPVFAAAVILPPDFENSFLNDSKKLSEKQRYELRPVIEEKALAFAVGIVDNHEIDRINILNASFLAMHRAIDQLKLTPEFLLIDGNRFKAYPNIKHSCIIKGDGKFLPIAAASILAKTYRDDYMNEIHQEYSQYQWSQNKGYPTRFHREIVLKIGITPYHRVTFANMGSQLRIEF
jgi:ribonuclease HII